jgi:hypothetical protein
MNPKLHEELRSDPFLAPCPIGGGHLHDQVPQACWDRGTTWCPRFPSPKQTKSLSVPADQRVGFNDDQEATPIYETRQGNQRDARRIVRTPWLRLPLDIQCQLLSKEQVLRSQLRS